MQDSTRQTHAFSFEGKGGEYFRIWSVNLALTLVTLGIYSAWAKVRRLQYFHRHTTLAGASFDYHGDPVAIIIGRLIAVVMFFGYQAASGMDPILGLAVLGLLIVVFPWLLQRSLRFKLANSSYRGLRFRFDGSVGGAYRAFLLWPALGYLSIGLLWPMAHQRIKRYQHANSRYGGSAFDMIAGAGRLYGIYLKVLGMLIALLVVAFLIAGGLLAGGGALLADLRSPHLGWKQQIELLLVILAIVVGIYLLAFLLLGPWFAARMQNLVWNNTTLGPHAFISNVRARDLLVIYLTNFLGIALTLGLYKPFADIRLAKYRIEHMMLAAEGDLEAFVADQKGAVDALGEEAAEVFDVDISF
jgi:uncharacterized membrane protein YjgN (DUF898 family)